MKAIIVAGGKGERLKPMTNLIPKSMIKVAGKPILEHIINLFRQNNISDLIISLCFQPKAIISYFGDGSKFGVNLNYILEKKDAPLGTAGSILNAKRFIHDTFIVVYGDILRQLDIRDVLNQHQKTKAFATLVTYRHFSNHPKSVIRINKQKRIIKFKERPHEFINRDYVWSNGSFYILEPAIFDFIPKNRPSDFGKDIFPQVISARKKVFAYPSKGYFIDIADYNKLKKARLTFKP